MIIKGKPLEIPKKIELPKKQEQSVETKTTDTDIVDTSKMGQSEEPTLKRADLPKGTTGNSKLKKLATKTIIGLTAFLELAGIGGFAAKQVSAETFNQPPAIVQEVKQEKIATEKQEIVKKEGKVLIQIDGLSYDALQEAMDKGYAPNMKAMIEKENYALKKFSCGLPAVTMSVLAQLFHNIPLPGNDWYDKETKKHVSAPSVQGDLQKQNKGLVTDGTSFFSPMTGGSQDTAFTIAGFKQNKIKEAKRSIKTYSEAIKEGAVTKEVVKEAFSEMKILTSELKSRGVYRSLMDKAVPELIALDRIMFEPTISTGIKLAMERGQPVIYTDVASYDDTAHYTENKSKLAMESLKKVDDFIGEMKHETLKANARDYNIIVFSDHGQTKAENFCKEFGMSVTDVILQYADDIMHNHKANKKDIVFTDVFSLGNLYFNSMKGTGNISQVEKKYPGLIQKMLGHPGIDMVVGREADNVIVYGKNGKVIIGDKVEVQGENPLDRYKDVGDTNQVAQQIKDYSKIPKTGDLILFAGWKSDNEVYDFTVKYTLDSLHGGFGGEQSRPFVLTNEKDPIDTSNVTNSLKLYDQLKVIVDKTK